MVEEIPRIQLFETTLLVLECPREAQFQIMIFEELTSEAL